MSNDNYKLLEFEQYLLSYSKNVYIDSSSATYEKKDPRWYIKHRKPEKNVQKQIEKLATRYKVTLPVSFEQYFINHGSFSVFNYHDDEIFRLLSPKEMLNDGGKIITDFFITVDSTDKDLYEIYEDEIEILKRCVLIEQRQEFDSPHLIFTNFNEVNEFYEWNVEINSSDPYEFSIIDEIDLDLNSIKTFNDYVDRLFKLTKEQIDNGN
jgi:hypothetical protein